VVRRLSLARLAEPCSRGKTNGSGGDVASALWMVVGAAATKVSAGSRAADADEVGEAAEIAWRLLDQPQSANRRRPRPSLPQLAGHPTLSR